MKLFTRKPKEACQLHGHQGTSGNRMLAVMLLASLAVVVWHVWLYGPTTKTASDGTFGARSFPGMLGVELSDLLFSKKGVVAELWEVTPYFLVGVLIAGYLRTFKIALKLQLYLRRYGVLSVVLASFIGAISPLCACGTLTTAISLLFAGIPLAPVMALMMTSPLLSPSTYLITLNDLGPEWTVIRTISALGMGIFGGLVTHAVCRLPGFGKKDIFIEGAIIRGDFHDEDYPDDRLKCNCRRTFGNVVAARTGNKFLVFLAKSSEMLWVVGKYILVGVIIGAVVERYMPREWIYSFFGGKSQLNILWITLASVPMFLHQISASSILYHIKSSLPGTLDGGAALAFMIAGPVTAIPTMVMFWTFFKKRVFALYLFICLAGSLLIAYGFQLLIFVPGVDLGNPLLKGVSSISGGDRVVMEKLPGSANVRVALEGASGKGNIASFKNDLDGTGGIVLDATISRFYRSTSPQFDNSRYILNSAEWLNQNSLHSENKSILLYVVVSKGDETGRQFLNEATFAELKRLGYSVEMTDRLTTPRITGRLLENVGQIWLLCDSVSENRPFDAAEIAAISGFVANGNSVLLSASSRFLSEGGGAALNRLAGSYGIRFYVGNRQSPEFKVSVAARLLNRSAEMLGAVLRLVRKA